MRALAKTASLSRVLIHEILASGPDGVTGVKTRPLWEVFGSLGIFGVLFAATVREYADARSYFVVLFAFITVLLSFTILPDTLDVREKRLELIRPRPVSPRVFFAAETITFLALVALVATVISTPPFIAAKLSLSVSWGESLGLFLALLACTWSVVTAWLCFLLFAARWLPMDRMRIVLQTALIMTILGALAASLAMHLGEEVGRISLEAAWIRFIPSTWFVDALVSEGMAPRLASIAMVAASGTLYWRLDPDRLYRRLSESPPRRRVMPVAPGLLGRLVPAKRQATAVTGLVLTVSGREEVPWLRTLTFRIAALGVFGAAMWSQGGDAALLWTFVLAHTTFVAILDGTLLYRESAEPEAAWILQASPLTEKELTRGLLWAVRLRYAVLPSALMGVHLFSSRPVLEAAQLFAAVLVVCALMEALVTRRYGLPLARMSSSVSGLLPSFLLGTVGLMVFAMLFAFFQIWTSAGVVAVAVIAGCVLLLRRTGLTPRRIA